MVQVESQVARLNGFLENLLGPRRCELDRFLPFDASGDQAQPNLATRLGILFPASGGYMLIIPPIPDFDTQAAQAARERQGQLTKPAGSLGQLEEISIQLAGITANPRPVMARKAIIVMAGDHGIVREGVSAYPAEVTPQMVLNFLHGGAAINVLARQAGARVVIVDVGVGSELPPLPGLVRRKVAFGTASMAAGPAMTRVQAEQALQVGLDVVAAEIDAGLDLVATGDMGIGNTTASSAIVAAFTGLPVARVTGRGTGLDDAGWQRKVMVIEQVLEFNRPDAADAWDVLAKVGGLEIAGLAGVVLGAASRRVPVVVDGFISGAAALVAAELEPRVKPFLIAAHQSVEIGHQAVLQRLGLRALLNLDLRLGEGTGAALAFQIIDASARILNEMATFAEAGVSGKE
jgi:nicotinate-nucleotide--dimethylbenzimidazole phosphoribosyltransferase